MLGLPRCSTRTATPFPDTTLFRAETGAAETPRGRDVAGSTQGDSAGGERGGRNSRARAELRSAGHEARSDRRAEDCEPEQGEACEHQGHSLLDHHLLVAECGRKLGEIVGSDADDDGEHHDLDARAYDVAEHALCEEGRAVRSEEAHV